MNMNSKKACLSHVHFTVTDIEADTKQLVSGFSLECAKTNANSFKNFATHHIIWVYD
jgi:hypothetical protein